MQEIANSPKVLCDAAFKATVGEYIFQLRAIFDEILLISNRPTARIRTRSRRKALSELG